ncbi:MAG: hypothetical protein CL676_10240 [Bdellovibrionaceae bacterium]|nr:hypothetical protein [Pseudobdellovibrionaceae bacterium]|tara:strand:+ start:2475 stop:2822 length:348 start_codon:yes stop_codon:yes gene_type:complete
MRALIFSLFAFWSFSTLVFLSTATQAAESQSKGAFRGLVESTIQTLYAEPSDQMILELEQLEYSHEEALEVWIVELREDSGYLKALFRVTIRQKSFYGEGEANIAQVQVDQLHRP